MEALSADTRLMVLDDRSATYVGAATITPLRAGPPLAAASAWRMHGPFAAWLVDVLRPSTFVELGTHYGYSYFTFCEAASALGHEMAAYGVDHWRGDEHAGEFEDSVFDFVDGYNARRFTSSTLLRMGFDDAMDQFRPGGVDLLHIDGLHTYDAVAHDFHSWRGRLSEKAVVLFHDVCEYQPGFGAHQFWDEIRADYPSFTFQYGHGLGVLAVGVDVPEPLLRLCGVDQGAQGDEVRAHFEALGHWADSPIERDNLNAELAASAVAASQILDVMRGERDQMSRELDVMRGERDQRSRELDVMRGERDQVSRELDAVSRELDEVRVSASWRATAPLRRLRSAVRPSRVGT